MLGVSTINDSVRPGDTAFLQPPQEIFNFFLESDLGSIMPGLKDGLQFDKNGNLLQGQSVFPNSQPLNVYLRDEVDFETEELIRQGDLYDLMVIYAIQHNMFKHASVNQNKSPQQWDFNKLGVTERFLETFRDYIPNGKEYDLTFNDLRNITLEIQKDYPPDHLHWEYAEFYDEHTSSVIDSAYRSNVHDLNEYIQKSNIPTIQEAERKQELQDKKKLVESNKDYRIELNAIDQEYKQKRMELDQEYQQRRKQLIDDYMNLQI